MVGVDPSRRDRAQPVACVDTGTATMQLSPVTAVRECVLLTMTSRLRADRPVLVLEGELIDREDQKL